MVLIQSQLGRNRLNIADVHETLCLDFTLIAEGFGSEGGGKVSVDAKGGGDDQGAEGRLGDVENRKEEGPMVSVHRERFHQVARQSAREDDADECILHAGGVPHQPIHG